MGLAKGLVHHSLGANRVNAGDVLADLADACGRGQAADCLLEPECCHSLWSSVSAPSS